MIKLSRWRAKIVTSLLPIPALLWLVLILKLSRYYEIVMEKKFVLVTYPGGEEEFVMIFEPRFSVMVSSGKVGNHFSIKRFI